MKINWLVRIKNKAFWLAVIPALAMVAQAVAALFGYTIVVDPTTDGVGDSKRAMSYVEPWKDEPEEAEAQ